MGQGRTEPMATDGRIILILGGTAEANRLAEALAEEGFGPMVLSLAGRTTAPVLPSGPETRIGGFGGPEGLSAFLRDRGIATLFDATHPFARRIAENASAAAKETGVPIVKLLRPPWTAVDGDLWISVASEAEAARRLPGGARPFLALGRQHLAVFAMRGDIHALVRMIEPPDTPPGFPADLVLSRPSSDQETEAALIRRHGATHLVCRNSGGAAAYAKIEAARRLGLPVVMIERPPAPETVQIVETVEAAVRWAAERSLPT